MFPFPKLPRDIASLPISALANGMQIFDDIDDPELKAEVIAGMGQICSAMATLCSDYSRDPLSMIHSCQTQQWINAVTGCSSEYGTPPHGWSSHVIKGAPTTYPRYGDIGTSWAPLNSNGRIEFLEFQYPQKLHVCGLDVFETFNPGYVSKFEGYDEDTKRWIEIWSRNITGPSGLATSQIFSPKFSVTPFKTNRIRMELDCRLAPSWVEIDAVRMRGRTGFMWDFQSHASFPYTFRKQVAEFWIAVRLHAKSFALPLELFTMIVRTLGLLYDANGTTYPNAIDCSSNSKKSTSSKKKDGICTQS